VPWLLANAQVSHAIEYSSGTGYSGAPALTSMTFFFLSATATFAVGLLDASIIGAFAVSLSSAYAIGDVLGLKHSLHRGLQQAKGFYAVCALVIAGAAAIVLIPGSPLGLLPEGVQVLAGLLLPSASVFLLLLCNDREVLGPWVNPPWLNALATVIIGVLFMLSGTLMATTLFPHLDAARIAVWLSIALAAGLAATAITLRIIRARRGAVPASAPVAPRAARRLADAAADPAQTGHLVTSTQARHARPARLPRPGRPAPAHQGHPARHPLDPAARSSSGQAASSNAGQSLNLSLRRAGRLSSDAPVRWKIASACRSPASASAVRPVARTHRARPASACASAGAAGALPIWRASSRVCRSHTVEVLGTCADSAKRTDVRHSRSHG
jgi:hypothetical protein